MGEPIKSLMLLLLLIFATATSAALGGENKDAINDNVQIKAAYIAGAELGLLTLPSSYAAYNFYRKSLNTKFLAEIKDAVDNSTIDSHIRNLQKQIDEHQDELTKLQIKIKTEQKNSSTINRFFLEKREARLKYTLSQKVKNITDTTKQHNLFIYGGRVPSKKTLKNTARRYAHAKIFFNSTMIFTLADAIARTYFPEKAQDILVIDDIVVYESKQIYDTIKKHINAAPQQIQKTDIPSLLDPIDASRTQ